MKFFRCQGNVLVAFYAAHDKISFVGFENVPLVGKLLQKSCAVAFAVGEAEFPPDKDGQDNDQQPDTPVKKLLHDDLFGMILQTY
jgi:hypothetical protein